MTNHKNNPWCASCTFSHESINGLHCDFYKRVVEYNPSRYCDETIHHFRKEYKNKRTPVLEWYKEYKKKQETK